MANSSAASRIMEKPTQQQQQQQESLKCPRCDSSNTKFCYYNNYSLTQPRHFCKACKRYWTRGGTLRNVPVGGGCRKNKRVKRPPPAAPSSSAVHGTAGSSDVLPSSNPNPNNNQVFYGLPTNPSELNLSYPRFDSRVSNVDTVAGYDLQPQMNALGLGFSYPSSNAIPSSNSLLSSYPMFGSSSNSSSTSPTMASVIASSLQQQQRFMGLMPYDDSVKMEGAPLNRFDWNFSSQNHNEIDPVIGSSDPNSVWNTSGVGAWLDPTSIGSSVSSLI